MKIQISWKFVPPKYNQFQIISGLSPRPASARFNYSSVTDPNTKVTLLQGSPCHSVESVQKLSNTEIISPYSVSSEDSLGLTYIQDDNANVEIEAVDLISLFEVEDGVFSNFPCSSPIKLAEIPKELLPIIKNCEVILV